MGKLFSKPSGSSSSSAAKGRSWTHKIYFDPEADKQSGSDYLITNEILRETLGRLVNPSEEIQKVIAYKHPLKSWQLTCFFFYHSFIVFETNNYWWSIEKNSEGITIQRSFNLETVRDKHRHTQRVLPIKHVKDDSARKNLKDLINWLYNEDELNNTYNVLLSNCQTFAKRVYNHVHGERTSKQTNRRYSYYSNIYATKKTGPCKLQPHIEYTDLSYVISIILVLFKLLV